MNTRGSRASGENPSKKKESRWTLKKNLPEGKEAGIEINAKRAKRGADEKGET